MLSPAIASAQQGDIEKQVGRMNKKAMEDYDSLEFESARKTLIDAVAMLRANGYDETPLAAKTYVNLGMLYIAGFKDRNRGVQQFVNALKIKPDTKLDAALATPELDEAFAAAQKQVGVGGGTTKPPVDNVKPPVDKPPVDKPPIAPPVEVKGLQHNPVDESRPNAPIPIRAQLGNDVGATRVFLFFRAGGQEDFISVPMKQQGADWVGVIPAEAVTGHAIQYYLEARDARGRPVVGSGSAPNPYIVTVSETAQPPTNVPEIDVEDPLAKERQRKKKEEEEKRAAHKIDHFFIFVMPGFGFGFEPGGNHTEVAWQKRGNMYQQQTIDSAGAALAPFHIGVEIGYLINNSFSISLVGRFQVVVGNNAETVNPDGMANAPTSKANGAIAGFVRARYRFLQGKFHPYVHADIGGGQIRHALDLSTADQDPNNPLVDATTAQAFNGGDTSVHQTVCANANNCVDSIALGLVLLGGGAGVWYDVAKHVALIADINIIGAIGAGGSQSGMNMDLQIGVGAHF
ncbi:MAG TPA: hypothetical protein VFF06_30700 [Polyangia bacterium]|nr:hypothetical protein [Polyangia bacterium]